MGTIIGTKLLTVLPKRTITVVFIVTVLATAMRLPAGGQRHVRPPAAVVAATQFVTLRSDRFADLAEATNAVDCSATSPLAATPRVPNGRLTLQPPDSKDDGVLALVVVAHPCADSLTHAAAERAEAGLRAAGYDVAMLDLYALGFRAAMSEAERNAYHGDTPVLDPLVAEHAELLTSAHALVFVYPTWWSGLPAIVKGWLERVMVPGVGFVLNEQNKVRPGLTNIRRLIGISTYGSPRSAVRVINDNGRRTITRAVRMSCGLRTRTRWLGLYAVDTSTDDERREFLASVEATLAAC